MSIELHSGGGQGSIKVLADVICKLSLDDETAGVLEPDPLDGLGVGDPLPLLHRRGDQLSDADGSLSSALVELCHGYNLW